MVQQKPRKQRNNQWHAEAVRFARLWANCAFATQAELADAEGLTEATLSRYLKYAFDHGILVARKPAFQQDKVDSQLQERMKEEDVRELLLAKLPEWDEHKHNRQLSIYRAPDRRSFCGLAAAEVDALLARAKVIGVSLGGTVAELIEALQQVFVDLPHAERAPPTVIPISGDMTHLMSQKVLPYSASNLAAELGSLLGSRSADTSPALAGVPAYVSPSFHESTSKGRKEKGTTGVFRRWIESIPGYRRIFLQADDGGPPLIAKTDCLLTGLGVAQDPGVEGVETGATLLERMAQETGDALHRIVNDALGDIGGFVIGKRGDASVADLNRGWYGITAEQLGNIAQRAAKKKLPGCVVLAYGASKARICKAVIERGFCNHLIIDESLAESLLEL
jgi:DNA-binding transcriptional regulator LsrR (DeoR family)